MKERLMALLAVVVGQCWNAFSCHCKYHFEQRASGQPLTRESGARSGEVLEQAAQGAASRQQIFFGQVALQSKHDRLGDGHELLAQALALARELDDASTGVFTVDRARHESALLHAVEDARHRGLVP